MQPTALPENIQTICKEFVQGLTTILGGKLYGVYMYGATVFEDSGRAQDLDCHVIVQVVPTDSERERLFALHAELERRFPPLGGEIDAYYLLLNDAKDTSPPENHLRLDIRDESWALHCAHVRAQRYVTLHGPEPTELFPSPSWHGIAAALNHEMRFIEGNLRYPAYCILNLCRIIYSFLERDVVVSKRFSGNWACHRFPQWAPLIEASMRSYESKATLEDDKLLAAEVKHFLEFASKHIRQIRDE
jgi:Aminoglycoside adenylyltransferase, C-terminal domain